MNRRLEEEQFVICAPSLTAQNQIVLNKLLTKINGTIKSEWSKNCTHLTLDEIKMEPQVHEFELRYTRAALHDEKISLTVVYVCT